jgi:OOP family OmpA-OmpF porin
MLDTYIERRFWKDRDMRKFALILATGTAMAMAAPAFADEGPADVDYDCALYDECTDAGAQDAGNVRGGFTMRRGQATAATKPVQATKQTAAISVTKPTANIATPKRSTSAGSMKSSLASQSAAQQITFFSGSADLQPSSKAVVQKLAAAMLRPDKVSQRFVIEGHTDAVGARESNLDLSKRRAYAVANYLNTLGVESKRLEIVGYGFDRPVTGQSKFSPANRRVVAKVVN